LTNGFTPNLGARFAIMTVGSRSGQFATIQGLDIGNDKRFQVTYSATGVTLDVVSASGVPSVTGGVAAPAKRFNWATRSVESNDTLWAIATAWGTTVDELLRLNPQIVDRDLIYPGQHINLPACHSATCQQLESQYQRAPQGTDESPCGAKDCGGVHVVQSGEHLSLIGTRYGMPWQMIYDANRDVIGNNPNRIFPGQKLFIPKRQN
jgi:LysM repeat protein